MTDIVTEVISDEEWPETATRLSNPSPYKLMIHAAKASGNAQRTNGFTDLDAAKKFRGALNTAANAEGVGMESRTVHNEDETFSVYWRLGAKREKAPAKVEDDGTAPFKPAKAK